MHVPADQHRPGRHGFFDSDIYRLSASLSSADWEITLPNALARAKAGGTTEVEVHATRASSDTGTTLSLTARSETDPTKAATASCDVSSAEGAAMHHRVTAAGPIVTNSSIGAYAADDGSRLHLNVDVRTTSLGGDDPFGSLAFEFTSGGKSYRLQSEDIALLRVGLDESSDGTCKGHRLDSAPCALVHGHGGDPARRPTSSTTRRRSSLSSSRAGSPSTSR